VFDLIELIGLVNVLLAIALKFTGDTENAIYFMACGCGFLLVAVIKHLKDIKGSL
jgi:hypothetical protein